MCVLNISENNIDAIEELKCLTNMTQFFVENNCLTDMKELSRVLASWTSLWRLETTGNPFCNKKKYRDRLIVMSRSLGKAMFQKLSCSKVEEKTGSS